MFKPTTKSLHQSTQSRYETEAAFKPGLKNKKSSWTRAVTTSTLCLTSHIITHEMKVEMKCWEQEIKSPQPLRIGNSVLLSPSCERDRLIGAGRVDYNTAMHCGCVGLSVLRESLWLAGLKAINESIKL